MEDDRIGYPDCRKEYYDIFNALVDAGTKPDTHITVETPLINMKKSDIVRMGMSLGAPFSLSWSCYQEKETPFEVENKKYLLCDIGPFPEEPIIYRLTDKLKS